jgi:putative addiction module component (TIGR02574 family)
VSSIGGFWIRPESTLIQRLDVGLKRSLRYPLPMIDQSLIAKVVSLSPAERLELIGAVWDSLSPEDIPVTDAEKAMLDARIADMERNPDDQSPWPDVKTRLERLLR